MLTVWVCTWFLCILPPGSPKSWILFMTVSASIMTSMNEWSPAHSHTRTSWHMGDPWLISIRSNRSWMLRSVSDNLLSPADIGCPGAHSTDGLSCSIQTWLKLICWDLIPGHQIGASIESNYHNSNSRMKCWVAIVWPHNLSFYQHLNCERNVANKMGHCTECLYV